MIDYLKKYAPRWVSKNELIENGCTVREFIKLDNTANIGRVWNKEKRVTEYRWYEPRDGDKEMQKALDDWHD